MPEILHPREAVHPREEAVHPLEVVHPLAVIHALCRGGVSHAGKSVPIQRLLCAATATSAIRRSSLARIGPMTASPHDQPPDSPDDRRSLGRWERWTTDWQGDPIVEFDSGAHAEWCEKWAPRCPDGNPARVRRALGFRERNIGELWLRVALGGDELGVCRVIVDEHDDKELPLFTPAYLDNVPQPDHGYRPAKRRQLSGRRR